MRNVIVTYAGIEHTACRFLDCTMTETTYSNLPPIPKDLATRAAPTLGVKLETGTTGALAGGSGQAAEGDGGRPEEEKTSERGALEGAASRDGAGGVSGMAQVVTRKSAVSPALDGVLRDLGLVGLESVRVHHCSNAFACVVHGEAGWKVRGVE